MLQNQDMREEVAEGSAGIYREFMADVWNIKADKLPVDNTCRKKKNKWMDDMRNTTANGRGNKL